MAGTVGRAVGAAAASKAGSGVGTVCGAGVAISGASATGREGWGAGNGNGNSNRGRPSTPSTNPKTTPTIRRPSGSEPKKPRAGSGVAVGTVTGATTTWPLASPFG